MFVGCVTHGCAMLLVTVVLFAGVCVGESKGTQSTARCSERARESVSVVASGDGVRGRYVVEYCARAGRGDTQWHLTMDTLNQPQENCNYEKHQEKTLGTAHSYVFENVTTNLPCPYICYSRPMDLMFRACYFLQNKLIRGHMTSEGVNSYFFADNNITEFSPDTDHFVIDIDYDTMVSFHWFEGEIPFTDYEILVWPNSTNCEQTRADVSDNCTVVRDTAPGPGLRCVLALPRGCYNIQLTHTAPWAHGTTFDRLFRANSFFCHTGNTPPVVPTKTGEVIWWGCGAGILLATVLGALLVRRLRHDAKARMFVWQRWISSQAVSEQKPSPAPAPGPRILLLYARDCPAAATLAKALTALLEEVAPRQVYDLYSPETTALAARAPASWLRSALAADGVKVVLLQTPALAALHAAELVPLPDAGAIKLCEPLLPRRVQYARPVFGDTLLQYALRLLRESPHDEPYNKYYLATVSSLPVDVFPTLVPYVRYELPSAAAALCRALRPHLAPGASTLTALNQAAADLVQYVRDHPHYLADELVFLEQEGDS